MEKIIIVCQDNRKFLVCINRNVSSNNGLIRIKSFRTYDKVEDDKSLIDNAYGYSFSRLAHIHFLIENGETAMGLLEEKETRFNWKKLKFVKTYAFECHVTPSGIKLSGTLEEIFY